MNQVLKTILVITAGFVLGSVVNMSLILLSGHVIPPPPGADVTTTEGLQASLHLFEPRHFVFPFLAHFLGTFAGAFAATWLAPANRMYPAYWIGLLFLLGGIASAVILPAPTWFVVLDLLLAYLPAAWLGRAVALRLRNRSVADT